MGEPTPPDFTDSDNPQSNESERVTVVDKSLLQAHAERKKERDLAKLSYDKHALLVQTHPGTGARFVMVLVCSECGALVDEPQYLAHFKWHRRINAQIAKA